MNVSFILNSRPVTIEAKPDDRLIDLLRDRFGLVGPKNGCAIGRCGACLVIVNGRPVNACLVLAGRLDGGDVATIEGLQVKSASVRDALAQAGAVQCGYCASGMVTMLTWLAAQEPRSTAEEVEGLMTGQICRCSGYGGLRRAIRKLFPDHV
jgi:aerobic carbon-monoxide dehydrogenase small subunit